MAFPSAKLPDYMRLLPPAALARIGKLDFISRRPVEGSITGLHKSPFKGFSVEFAEHRQYAPGDDPRHLDWRILGKVDRYYIKQYIEETNLRATMMVDASGSMAFAGEVAAPINGRPASKFEYAQHVAALLSYLLIHQQDAVGLVTFDQQIRKYLPARSRASQIRVILEELNQTEPGDETDLAPILHDVAERIQRRGLVVILSDLLCDTEALVNSLHHFRYRKHEVLLVHIMAEEELSFPYDQWTNFRNLEDLGMQAQLDPKAIRAAYLQRVSEHVRKLQAECGRLEIDYLPMNTKQPYEVALVNYLADRRR